MQALADALNQVDKKSPEVETTYLKRLADQVQRALDKTCVLAADVQAAKDWLLRIKDCLRYPPSAVHHQTDTAATLAVTSAQVRTEMEALLKQFQPYLKHPTAQATLYHGWHRLWDSIGEDLLHCYDIPGLPPDNLKIEAHFGQLRNHQRRISGRASTRPLRDFGSCQVLFLAESETELLGQLRQVPLAEYKNQRQRLAEVETDRQCLTRLHRDPVAAARRLLHQHTARRAALACNPSQARAPS